MVSMVKYTFCPQCAGKLKLAPDGFPRCQKCAVTYYRNSKPTAGVLPVKNGQVLLARRGVAPFIGEWDIIGGFLLDGEHPEVGALREALEETGLTMHLVELLGIYTDKYYGKDGDHVLCVHYIAEIVSGTMKAQDDVAELVWADIENPPHSNGFSNTNDTLRDLKKWYLSSKRSSK